MSTGTIRWAQAELVHENDGFALNGFDKPPTHTYDPFSKDRGDVVGVYVVVKTADGDYLTETMSLDEVNAIQDRSSAWHAWLTRKAHSPWVTEALATTTDEEALAYWKANNGRLARQPQDHARLKQEIMRHRQALHTEAQRHEAEAMLEHDQHPYDDEEA